MASLWSDGKKEMECSIWFIPDPLGPRQAAQRKTRPMLAEGFPFSRALLNGHGTV